MKNYAENLGWKIDVDFPSWANTEIYVKTISKGYLLDGEKPKVLSKFCSRQKIPNLRSRW